MPLEYPLQDYFPSAKVRLTVRFEEFTSNSALKKDVPKVQSKDMKGTGENRDDLVVTPDTTTFQGVTVFRLEQKTGADKGTGGPGTAQTKSSDNLTHAVGGIIPKSADWRQNGFRTADTLALTIRWSDMPVDPRVVRACAVEYFLGTVTSQEFAQGIRGQTRADVFGGGVPNSTEKLNLVPDTYLDQDGRGRTNLRFQGWVDKWKMAWSDGEPVVELECVDNTRLLLDQPQPSKGQVGMEKPIDEAIADYLRPFPQLAGMSVVYLPAGIRDKDNPPKLKTILANTSFVPNLGPPASKGGGAAGGEQASLWDYLTDVVSAIGHGLRLEGTQIIIQRIADAVDGHSAPRPDDPYHGRKLPSGDYPVRAFVYGRNISELTVAREFSRKKPTNIEVRCYTPRRKNILVARFPEKADRVISANPGDGKADQKWTVVRAPPGITDAAVLKKFAEDLYNTWGRQELSVAVKTKNLASFGGGNEDPDLLDMRPGDNFELLVDRSQAFNTLTEAERMLSAEGLNAQFVGKLGYSAEFAAAYARAYTNAGFQRAYRLKEMGVSWSDEEGVAFELSGVNYVEARVDKPSEATVKGASAPTKKPPAHNSGAASPKAAPSIPQPAPVTIPPGFTQIGESATEVIVQNQTTHELRRIKR